MDVFTKEKRSEIMSRIRAKNTKAERIVFRYLRSHKIYFQRHYRGVPGCLDIALPRKKITVFIDGDFWHGRDFRKRKNALPEYWQMKIKRNIDRDRQNRKRLIQEGWRVLCVWEKDLLKQEAIFCEKIRHFLTSRA